MPQEKEQYFAIPAATEWIKKEGYETCLLADALNMGSPGTEVQLVRFYQGKYGHHHEVKTEFFYFIAGKGRVVIDGQKIAILPGTVLLIKPGEHHEFVNNSDTPLEAIMFKTNSQPDDTFAGKTDKHE